MEREAGKTKDVGFAAGVRRTFDIPPDKAWEDLFSAHGLAVWLGEIIEGAFALGQSFCTNNGATGKLTVFKPYSHIRMQWKSPEWENTAIVQVRVLPAPRNKTTVSFHQEKLLDSAQRRQMTAHWAGILDQLAAKLWQV